MCAESQLKTKAVSDPITQKRVWDEYPEDYPHMEFRLLYDGPLKAAGFGRSGGRSSEKHVIRKALHKQLLRLWTINPQLQMLSKPYSTVHPFSVSPGSSVGIAGSVKKESLPAVLGDKFNRCGYRFVPVVSNHMQLSCGLEILFLRRDMPGVPLIHSGGDIDNRLKVLFDALRVPTDCAELTDAVKDADEEPYFFCLLEDDALITEVSVTTDTLLTPCASRDENDVHLVIKAKVRPTGFSFDNLVFVP